MRYNKVYFYMKLLLGCHVNSPTLVFYSDLKDSNALCSIIISAAGI